MYSNENVNKSINFETQLSVLTVLVMYGKSDVT